MAPPLPSPSRVDLDPGDRIAGAIWGLPIPTYDESDDAWVVVNGTEHPVLIDPDKETGEVKIPPGS